MVIRAQVAVGEAQEDLFRMLPRLTFEEAVDEILRALGVPLARAPT